jgi:organic hydroperoxide reductase OsmC/OhrA
MEPHYYHVNLQWSKDRKGMMCSPELESSASSNGCIEVATPPQFPKGVPGIWSPEHLFTAAVTSCYMTTFLSVAENSKLHFEAFSCRGKAKLDRVDNMLKMTEILIEPILTIPNEADRDRAIRILNKTESLCLIPNSITSKVIMKPSIEIAEDQLLTTQLKTIE